MNTNPTVDNYLLEKAHPMNSAIQRVREIILECHPELEETIKWNSPTFIYKGNMASFFMNAKKHVSLMFHHGAFIDDQTGLLQGDGKETRTAKFQDLDDVECKRDALEHIVNRWIQMRDES